MTSDPTAEELEKARAVLQGYRLTDLTSIYQLAVLFHTHAGEAVRTRDKEWTNALISGEHAETFERCQREGLNVPTEVAGVVKRATELVFEAYRDQIKDSLATLLAARDGKIDKLSAQLIAVTLERDNLLAQLRSAAYNRVCSHAHSDAPADTTTKFHSLDPIVGRASCSTPNLSDCTCGSLPNPRDPGRDPQNISEVCPVHPPSI